MQVRSEQDDWHCSIKTLSACVQYLRCEQSVNLLRSHVLEAWFIMWQAFCWMSVCEVQLSDCSFSSVEFSDRHNMIITFIFCFWLAHDLFQASWSVVITSSSFEFVSFIDQTWLFISFHLSVKEFQPCENYAKCFRYSLNCVQWIKKKLWNSNVRQK